MSEMIENVADGLIADFVVQVEESAGKPFAETGVTIPDRLIWVRKARAAIKAMREPTAAMINCDGVDCGERTATKMWRSMIDEALR